MERKGDLEVDEIAHSFAKVGCSGGFGEGKWLFRANFCGPGAKVTEVRGLKRRLSGAPRTRWNRLRVGGGSAGNPKFLEF